MFTIKLSETGINDLALVGGKNASLGEMLSALSSQGVNVPDGFAITSEAWWEFIYSNKLKEKLADLMHRIDKSGYTNLKSISEQAKNLIMNASIPDEVREKITEGYKELCKEYGELTDVAVRSSATAEDLPDASFAGQHESFLNVRGEEALLDAVRKCYASFYNERAIKYREDKQFDHGAIAISVCVQKMVRSDMSCSGICFTLEPESGFPDLIHISAIYGLGENIVQGAVNPDEYFVFKPTLKEGKYAIINRKLGTKEKMMVYAGNIDHQIGRSVVNIPTPVEQREQFVLTDEEIELLATWSLIIEDHYKRPMDIEWAKDGFSGELYIVQARPETAHGVSKRSQQQFILKEKGKVLTTGIAIGKKISSGRARILRSPSESDSLLPGEILVTEITNPDWDVVMKKASAIITNKGGRTSHASIVARELGIAAVVGTNNATDAIKDGQMITVSCAEGQTGQVYEGALKWEELSIDLSNIKMPRTHPMLIVADPDKAFELSFYPNAGVGLMRLEFVISNSIRIHPMALVKFDELKDEKLREEIENITHHFLDKEQYFITHLAEAVSTIAAAFYPKDVIVRMSDFKTNEYANLIGGKLFEPEEENPMIGFRGASRYYNDRYRDGFKLECDAMKLVREGMGLTNVKLMIPFCRTVDEARKVIETMESFGLKRGENGLEIYMMTEIPSNVILAEEFAKYFDGFSIGSNDLTQLTLGIDRDSSIISEIFDERNEAAKRMIAEVIRKAKAAHRKIGLCGQAPSDFPEYAGFLVEQGIDSISFNPDALLKGIENIHEAERRSNQKMPKAIGAN